MSGRMQRPWILVLRPNTGEGGGAVTVRPALCGPKLTEIDETPSQSNHDGAGEVLSRSIAINSAAFEDVDPATHFRRV